MRIIVLVVFAVVFNLIGYAQNSVDAPPMTSTQLAGLYLLCCDSKAPAESCPGADSCEVKPGSVTKSQVEEVGLVWNDIVEELVKNNYAEVIGPEEFRFTADIEKDGGIMSGISENEKGKILDLLVKAKNKNHVKFFDRGGKLIEERYADENNDIILKKYNESGELVSENKLTKDRIDKFIGVTAKPGG